MFFSLCPTFIFGEGCSIHWIRPDGHRDTAVLTKTACSTLKRGRVVCVCVRLYENPVHCRNIFHKPSHYHMYRNTLQVFCGYKNRTEQQSTLIHTVYCVLNN